jgi:UDP:flavonoid glycosyltransferase YjiC (YdhE family)
MNLFLLVKLSDNCEDTIDYIPGVQAIEPKDLMSELQVTDTSTPLLRLIKKALHEVKRADFILCNTVQELEVETLLALQGKQPTYAIGPVFPNEPTKSVVATNLMSEFDCTQWLKNKPQGSVLYVSFGSYCQVTKNEFEEIAQGLLLSKVSFIWVLRPDTISYEEEGYILPFGLEDQNSDRGFIVPWCSQIEVLSNPAIGGFLTHCGWNSVLESMRFGVPMLCFPIFSDQITNRKLVVDDWGIGLNLCDRKPITRLEVAEKINRLMSGKLGDGMLHKEIKKARQTLEDALAVNGSSQQSLCKFISDVKAKIQARV